MDIDLESISSQFSNLDPENIGNWPILVRTLIIIVACAAVLGGGYYFDTQDQLMELEQYKSEENNLKGTFETNIRDKTGESCEPGCL